MYNGVFNGFQITANTGISIKDGKTASLFLNSLAVTNLLGGTNSITVWLTDTGYTIPNLPVNPNAVTTGTFSTTTTGTVNYAAYLDPLNKAFTGGAPMTIMSGTIASPDGSAFSGADNTGHLLSDLSGPFSMTEAIGISMAGALQSTSLDFQVDTTPVPEPGTFALIGAGLFALAVFSRRKMNKA